MEKRTITDAELEWFRNCLLREDKSSAKIQKYLRDVRAFAHYARGDSVGKEMVIPPAVPRGTMVIWWTGS